MSVAKAANEVNAPSRITVYAEGISLGLSEALTESLETVVIRWC
jgi:hypothetical protein